MWRLFRGFVLGTLILTLAASNLLLLTSNAFNAAVSAALMSTLGVRTVSAGLSASLSSSERRLQNLQRRQLSRSAAVRGFGRSLSARTRRVAARGIAAIPAESIPYVGAAVLVAGIGYELYEACQTLRELQQLYRDLGIEEAVADDALASVCSPPELGMSLR